MTGLDGQSCFIDEIPAMDDRAYNYLAGQRMSCDEIRQQVERFEEAESIEGDIGSMTCAAGAAGWGGVQVTCTSVGGARLTLRYFDPSVFE
jgi:hypothetical protein